MADLLKGEGGNLMEKFKSEIKTLWHKEDVTHIYDTYFKGKILPTSWQVAEKMGHVRGNAVLNTKGLNSVSWSVMAVRSSIDIFDKLEAAGNTLTDFDRVQILDQSYEEKVHSIAVNWNAASKKNK